MSKCFDTLCISGGGTKGIAFLGAIKALCDSEIIDMKNIDTLIGTSMGGIICFLLSINYEISELIYFAESFNFEIMTPNINIEKTILNYGLDSGDKLYFVLTKFLEQKTKKTNLTMKEHYELTKKKLIVSVTNYSTGFVEYISYENYPNLPIILACRMTSCLPLYFVPVKINLEDWKFYTNSDQKCEHNEFIFLDGGILDNFPIQLGSNETTIGILMNNSDSIYECDSIVKFLSSIVGMTTHFMICHKLNNHKNIINLKITNVEVVKLKMNKKFKKKLIDQGYMQTLDYVRNNLEQLMRKVIDDIIDNF